MQHLKHHIAASWMHAAPGASFTPLRSSAGNFAGSRPLHSLAPPPGLPAQPKWVRYGDSNSLLYLQISARTKSAARDVLVFSGHHADKSTPGLRFLALTMSCKQSFGSFKTCRIYIFWMKKKLDQSRRKQGIRLGQSGQRGQHSCRTFGTENKFYVCMEAAYSISSKCLLVQMHFAGDGLSRNSFHKHLLEPRALTKTNYAVRREQRLGSDRPIDFKSRLNLMRRSDWIFLHANPV